jgi:preprotein translocase subunit SecF
VLLITSGLISAYTFVRLNWVSVIPVFLGTLVTPLLAVGIIAICQIYFDLYIIMAIVVLYAINAILVINLTGTLNNQWLRKQIYHKQDLKKIINAEIKNSLSFYLKFYIITVVSVGIFMLFNSTDLIWLFLIIIIGTVGSIAVLYSVVPFFLYLFIRLRYHYLLRTSNIENPLLRKNYDPVDEQLLDDINKFKRKRPTL